MFFNIPREDSVISLLKTYLDLNFDALHAASGNRYADKNDIRLVNLGPIDLFSKKIDDVFKQTPRRHQSRTYCFLIVLTNN